MACSASRSSPSGPSAPMRTWAKPVTPASMASSSVAASTVLASRAAVASANRSDPAASSTEATVPAPAPRGPPLFFPPVPDHHGHIALGEVAGADLDPDGHALELPVHAAPAEAGVRT